MTTLDAGAEHTLRAIAGYGLEGAPRLPCQPLGDGQFGELLQRCEDHRLLGLLGAAARTGAFSLTADQRERLEAWLAPWLAHAVRLEHLVLDALERLSAAGIDARILKGVALAHTVYAEPSDRVFRDVDVLVHAEGFGAAVEILERTVSAHREVPELHRGFDERFGKEALLRTGYGLEFDLHRTLVEGALGLTVHLPDLFAPAACFRLGPTDVLTLAAPQQFLHAAYTVILGDWPPRLSAMRDLVQTLVVLDPAPDAVLELAHRWRAELVVARALIAAWDALTPSDTSPLLDWAYAYRPRPVERALVASHLGSARAFTRHAAALLVAPGVGGRLAYLQAIAWPDRRYLESRGFTRRSFVTRAWERIVG